MILLYFIMLGKIFLKYVRCICMLLYVVCFYIFNFVFIYVLVYENLKKYKVEIFKYFISININKIWRKLFKIFKKF